METIFQFRLDKPFVLKDVDRLYYACNYVDSKQFFLMEKEKFHQFIIKGFISETRQMGNY